MGRDVTQSGKVVFCEMRPGVGSYTNNETDRSFMELGPLLMTGISERISSPEGTGNVESVIINFQKDSVLLTKLKHGFLAISADRASTLHTFEEIDRLIRGLED